jgi:uncharacterized metal-binding protein
VLRFIEVLSRIHKTAPVEEKKVKIGKLNIPLTLEMSKEERDEILVRGDYPMAKSNRKNRLEISCVDCKAWACFPDVSTAKAGRREPPPYCPSNAQKEVCKQALAKYNNESHVFAKNVALVENACYAIDPNTRTAVLPMVTLHSRAEEIIMLAKISGFKKLGLAFGVELQQEARLYTDILEKNGFEVVSVCCKAGGIPKEEIGITEDEKLYGPGSQETMCSGLIMAELLNSENTDMNILMGLGVGQDTLFYKYTNAFTVPFVIMDRVYGGATMEGVYQCFNSWGFRNYTERIANGFELMRSAWLKREGAGK